MSYQDVDLMLTDEEQRSIYNAWPYPSAKSAYSNLVELRSAILNYFGINESHDLEEPHSISSLLDQLRQVFGIVDVSFTKSSNNSLTGDSGLILFCLSDSFHLIKPDQWFRHQVTQVEHGTVTLLIYTLPPKSASLFQIFKRILYLNYH